MTTGYKTITPIQIGNLLHSLAVGAITWSTARVWFAAMEMVAIREAAIRVRRQRRDKRQVEPEYRRTELSKLTGLSARAIGKSVIALRQTGMAILTTRAIEVVNHSMPEAGETIQMISGGRSPKRPIPIPRPILRYLAQQPKAGIGKVMLGYICRGMTIDRQGGDVRGVGTVKASWLADVLELSLRSVRYAQAEIRKMGWIGKDTGSKQWKLNRHGAWFSIELDWNPPEILSGQAAAKALEGQPEIAPPPPEKCTPVAPPKEDQKTLSESKNQKPGVFEKVDRKTSPPKTTPLPAANLKNILPADLSDRERLEALFQQAVDREWVRPCESDKLNFLAAAVRARTTPARDPIRVFVDLVRNRRWHHLTQAHEDEVRGQFKTNSVPARRTDEPCSSIGAVLGRLVAQGGVVWFPATRPVG